MHLVTVAAQAGDKERLTRLQDLGSRLVEAAGGADAPAEILRWAAHLDWNNYSIHRQGKGHVVKVNVPENVTQALAPVVTRLDHQSVMYRLLSRYRSRRLTPYRFALADLPSDQELTNDFNSARSLEAALDDDYAEPSRRALAGVAAAILRRAARAAPGPLPPESFGWALSLLIHYATAPYRDGFDYDYILNPDGADRQAALALPWVFVGSEEDRSPAAPECDIGQILAIIGTALSACTSSRSPEVRINAAEGLRITYVQACEQDGDGNCWHDLVWQAIDAGCRNVVLGTWSEDGQRHIEVITGDINLSLAQASDDSLMLPHIASAAICTLDAAGSDICIRARAQGLRDALIDAYARAACHWAEEHYDWRKEQQAAFAAALLRWAVGDSPQVLVACAEKLRASLGALSDYLDALMIVATHESNYVSELAKVWPQLMEMGLAAIREGEQRGPLRQEETLLGSLIPSPSAFGYPNDLDAVLVNARSNWFPLHAVSKHVVDWLARAQGQMSAVDALVGFLQTQPIQDQAQLGLEWVQSLVVSGDGTASTSGFLLVGWLGSLRQSSVLDTSTRRVYRVIVDALVLSNFKGARDLQRLDE
jgi:hypothetical protein